MMPTTATSANQTVLGAVADQVGMVQVFALCAFLPMLGFLTIFLPRTAELHEKEPA